MCPLVATHDQAVQRLCFFWWDFRISACTRLSRSNQASSLLSAYPPLVSTVTAVKELAAVDEVAAVGEMAAVIYGPGSQ